MNVLVGTDSDGWNRRGYVALLFDTTPHTRATLTELVAFLKQAGAQRPDIRLAGSDDSSHAMSASEHAEFWACWERT